VTDPTGFPVPNTEVIIKSAEFGGVGAIAKTDQNGIFIFDATVSKRYELDFRAPGFKVLHKSVEVVGSPFEVGNIPLEIARADPDLPVDYVPLQLVSSPVNSVLRPIGADIQIRGRYANIDYGFRVDVLTGFAGEGSVPPAPDHGFAVALAEKAVVWVDGSYEMPDSPHTFRQLNTRLGTLKAERRSWSDTEEGTTLLHESIVARGFYRHTPIIYRIQLDTTVEHWAKRNPSF
jgi:hypothetical protein